MEKIKEKINELKSLEIKYGGSEPKGFSAGVYTGLKNSLEIINQELQDYTFIRVPKKVKLSEIVERLQEEVCKAFNVLLQKISQFTKYIVIQNLEDEDDTKFVVITENEIEYLENQDTNECEFFPKWLYAMYIAGTEIEVDV